MKAVPSAVPRISLLLQVFGQNNTSTSSLPPPTNLFSSCNFQNLLSYPQPAKPAITLF